MKKVREVGKKEGRKKEEEEKGRHQSFLIRHDKIRVVF